MGASHPFAPLTGQASHPRRSQESRANGKNQPITCGYFAPPQGRYSAPSTTNPTNPTNSHNYTVHLNEGEGWWAFVYCFSQTSRTPARPLHGGAGHPKVIPKVNRYLDLSSTDNRSR